MKKNIRIFQTGPTRLNHLDHGISFGIVVSGESIEVSKNFMPEVFALNHLLNVTELSIFGRTIILKESLNLPNTKLTIICENFEVSGDNNTSSPSINVTPAKHPETRAPQFENGLKGVD